MKSLWLLDNRSNWKMILIFILCFYDCLFVCPFVSNKRQNGWSDRAQITKQCVKNYIFNIFCENLRFLCLQRWGLVSKLGQDSPALFTATILNWYHLPSLNPGTLASSSSIVAQQWSSLVIKASNQPREIEKKTLFKLRREKCLTYFFQTFIHGILLEFFVYI